MDRLQFHLKKTCNWVVDQISGRFPSPRVNQEQECFPFARNLYPDPS